MIYRTSKFASSSWSVQAFPVFSQHPTQAIMPRKCSLLLKWPTRDSVLLTMSCTVNTKLTDSLHVSTYHNHKLQLPCPVNWVVHSTPSSLVILFRYLLVADAFPSWNKKPSKPEKWLCIQKVLKNNTGHYTMFINIQVTPIIVAMLQSSCCTRQSKFAR